MLKREVLEGEKVKEAKKKIIKAFKNPIKCCGLLCQMIIFKDFTIREIKPVFIVFIFINFFTHTPNPPDFYQKPHQVVFHPPQL